jgi:serine-type D-Ala-D-Ala carboxypeptidase (penicillin-binding protein 5/6)
MDDGKWTNIEVRRSIGILTFLFLLVASATGAPLKGGETPSTEKAGAEKEPTVFAESAALIDSFTGEFLYLKNENAIQYPASSTKILTALLVIEAGDLDTPVTVDISDTKVEPTKLELLPGEQYTRRQLLYGLMLKSANDVAMTLARDNAGSVDAFAEKMTRRAAELGATNSHFANPNGLHDLSHYTTAHDLALISRAAMEHRLLHLEVAERDRLPAAKS